MQTFRIRRREIVRLLPAGALLLAPAASRAQGTRKEEKEVEAAEDLMREHGVLRRLLLAYSAAAARLRNGKASEVPPQALAKAASLFRTFGEDYHERTLEEKHVFPVLAQTKGEAARYPAILKAQHDRGRAITDYVASVARPGRIASADHQPLAAALEGFVLMYRHHAAVEDTVVFAAWKAALPEERYKQISQQFEAIEHTMFGEDGFEDAVKRVSAIEQELGLSDLAAFTAPPPPTK